MRDEAEAWFVDEQINILRGAAAEAAIQTRSDSRYWQAGQGITRIPQERWRIAQTFERAGWMEKWRGATDDRNLFHAEAFNSYHALHGRHFKHAIELGCGPFTNLRVIGDFVRVDAVSLLDPLLESYLQLPKCRYTRQVLRLHSGKQELAVAETFACPIEEMPAQRNYDLIVMMNVIEHCFDVELIFEKILAISRPGTVFIFHDSIYDAEKTRSVLERKYYEAGHPLMVGYEVMEQFMARHFSTLYFSRIPEPDDQIEVCPHVGRFYFIGERK
jgi:SAM-dependent methyltransferase